MLQITRNRTWSVAHTVLESDGGPPTDLSQFDEIRSQIRSKVATRSKDGFFRHEIIVTVSTSISGGDNEILTLSLSRASTRLLQTGDYLIDVVAIKGGVDESLLDPEPIKVVNRPTLPENTDDLPDFSAMFLSALNS